MQLGSFVETPHVVKDPAFKDSAGLTEDLQKRVLYIEDGGDSMAAVQKQANTTSDGDLIAEVETILGEAGQKANDTKAGEALKDMQEAEGKGQDPSSLVVGHSKDHEALMKAIEEVSRETSPEDELNETGAVITSEMLSKLNNLSDTPEQASLSSLDSDLIVEGDMVANNRTHALLLLEASGKNQRWASNTWKNHRQIPYCFSSSIASSSKRAWQDAVQHYVDHIPCLGFQEVAVASESEKTCATQP
eukprot:CAMPEP_0170588264 /NCGR_PEP_ID=MMETSP0224-20130122/10737_1 /TAXON_ID=285029 /ORGANISM="Togula jolla, Strain CCCM 725" /LENGTH=246 /DNA_ID=CAMNT_0010911969 /DNA_START=214 /DNA_END=950 /DNA_ORIENTATION=-